MGVEEKGTRIIKSKKGIYLCQKHYLQCYRHGKTYRTIYDSNKINIKKDHAEVEIYNKKGELKCITIIDKHMIDFVSDKKLYEVNGYVRFANSDGSKEFLHRHVANCPSNKFVDHINHNTLDNRGVNLRIADKQENAFNINKNICKGVKPYTKSRFKAVIMKDYKNYWLGLYPTKNEALYARYLAETILFKDYRDKTCDNEKKDIFKSLSVEVKDNIKTKVQLALK